MKICSTLLIFVFVIFGSVWSSRSDDETAENMRPYPPKRMGQMNIYIRKDRSNDGSSSYKRFRFPVAQYGQNKMPFTGPFLSFMPRIPIFVDRFTKQTIIFAQTGGIYIIPPVINMFGQMFSIGELIASGYASLVSSGAAIPTGPINMLPFFQPIPLLGPQIPKINPSRGGFRGGMRTNLEKLPKYRDDYQRNSEDYYQKPPIYNKQPSYPTKPNVTTYKTHRFTKIIVFGDSFSDTGRVYGLTNKTWPIVPPYYKGRYCDAFNWVDRLTGVPTISYAYGGATTDNNFVVGLVKLNTVPVPGVRQQIEMYLNDTSKTTIDFSSTLYIFWAGGNDFIFNRSSTPTQIVSRLMYDINIMLAIGAKHILVFNQIPVQLFPFTIPFNNTALFTAMTAAANAAITGSLMNMQANFTDASINIFNIHDLVLNVTSNATSVKFENTVSPCWTQNNLTAINILCFDPKKYLFLDIFHFSSPVHQLMANAIQPFLSYKYNPTSSYPYIIPLK